MAFNFTPTYSSSKNDPTDILLVLPNMNWFNKRVKFCAPFTAISLTTIMRKAGYDFILIDGTIEDLSPEEYEDRLRELQPKIVLVSSISVQYAKQTHLATEIAKKALPNCTTIHGGIYATTYPEGAIEDPNTDYLFIGPAEGRLPQVLELLLEERFDDLINEVNGIGYRDKTGKFGRSSCNVIPKNPNWSGSGLKKTDGTEPDYSKVDMEKYLFQKAARVEHSTMFNEPTAVIQTCFGCVYKCTFCATQTITGIGIMYRDVEVILDEIEWFKKEFGITHFGIIDEMLLLNRKRCMKLFQGMIDRKLNITWKLNDASLWHMHDGLLEKAAESGCVRIGCSAESGSQRVLDEVMEKPVKLDLVEEVVKKCNELGVAITSNFIIGMPDETWDEILETVDFADRTNFDLVAFHVAQPFPGTPMVKTCIEKGYLPKDFDFRDERQFGNSTGFINTPEFNADMLMNLRTYAWDYVNFKTPEKKKKAAECLNIPLSEIDEHRLESRKKQGVHAAKQEFLVFREEFSSDKAYEIAS